MVTWSTVTAITASTGISRCSAPSPSRPPDSTSSRRTRRSGSSTIRPPILPISSPSEPTTVAPRTSSSGRASVRSVSLSRTRPIGCSSVMVSHLQVPTKYPDPHGDNPQGLSARGRAQTVRPPRRCAAGYAAPPSRSAGVTWWCCQGVGEEVDHRGVPLRRGVRLAQGHDVQEHPTHHELGSCADPSRIGHHVLGLAQYVGHGRGRVLEQLRRTRRDLGPGLRFAEHDDPGRAVMLEFLGHRGDDGPKSPPYRTATCSGTQYFAGCRPLLHD